MADLYGHSWIAEGNYSGGFSLFFWGDRSSNPQAGLQLTLSGGTATLSDLVDGELETLPFVAYNLAGRYRVLAQQHEIILWLNGHFTVAFNVPERYPFRLGWIGYGGGASSMEVDELFEPTEPIVWGMKDSARSLIDKFLEGRDGYLLEHADGSITVKTLDYPPELGTFTGEYFSSYEQGADDAEWASAMVAYGGEDWVLLVLPDATRLRWTEWQTPYIYDPAGLRSEAMDKLRKLYALRDMRGLQGPLDPRVEPGDKLVIDEIRGIPAGTYLVRSVDVVGKPGAIDMVVTVQRVPDEIPASEWSVVPGIDRPTRGE